ncbi:type II toxin-antitoxin system Phd/YefM family antitoxin, partial [Patescibacteria group bacterium]|nr:type II toxin-antitoxin system Phd/YefM family antitoxin [Patescibacteria group bacterium]MBU1500061.1 type II toxin-antitoxin system Phd/YefM family antitoxin [Patescibacteria group bacterium]
MTTISVSELKANPAAAINQALDYPLAVLSRSKVKAYLVGKDLFEKLLDYLEDISDRKVISKTDFSKGESLDKVAKELGLEL